MSNQEQGNEKDEKNDDSGYLTEKEAIPETYKNIKVDPEDNDGEVLDMKEEEKSGEILTTINIIKNILGAGLFNFAVIIRTLGIFFGCVAIFYICFLSYITGGFLLQCKDLTHKYSYSMFGKITMGKTGTLLLRISLFFSCLGTCCFYFKLLGNLIVSLLGLFFEIDDSFFYSPVFYTLICFFLILPLIYFENINALDNTSFLGVLSIFLFLSSISILFIIKLVSGELVSECSKNFVRPYGSILEIFACYSAITDAFCYKHNFFPIYLTLKNRNNKKMKRASLIGLLFCAFIYSTVGILCFLMFGYGYEDVISVFQKEIFNNMKNRNFKIVIIYVVVVCSYIISSLLTFPLLFFSVKNNLLNIIIYLKQKYLSKTSEQEGQELKNLDEKNDELVGNQKKEVIGKGMKILIVTITYLIVLIFTLFVDSIIGISNAMGSTTSNLVMFIFPSFFIIRLEVRNKKNIMAWFILLLGLATILFYFTSEIYKIIF